MSLLFDASVYGQVGAAEERVASAVLALRASLLHFYKLRRQEHPSEELTHLADLKAKLVGARASKKLKTKGAETWGFALFALWELRRHQARLPTNGTRLLRPWVYLERIVRIWRRSRWVMSPTDLEDRRIGNGHTQTIITHRKTNHGA